MPKYNEVARILENADLGAGQYLMRLQSPLVACEILPGQFVQLLLPRFESHILRRPFSVLSANAETGEIEVLYQLIGEGTHHMAKLLPDETLECLGPLGSFWNTDLHNTRVLLVGGGVGSAPLYMLARRLLSQGCQVDVVLGAQTKAALTLKDKYEALGTCGMYFATDDGSFGRAGFVTAWVEELVQAHAYDYVATCGPEPMMRAVYACARDQVKDIQVSLERRMACGLGACLTCAVDTKQGRLRSCSEGPIFTAGDLLWD